MSGSLINRRRFADAYSEAQRRVWAEPKNPEAWIQLHLAALLATHPLVASAAKSTAIALGCTDHQHGDMLRDEALYAIRWGLVRVANRLLVVVHDLHADDDNRIGCWRGATARCRFMGGHYKEAAGLHQSADEWMTDPQWRYNNLLPWLRAVVAAHGRSHPQVKELVGRIALETPPGAKNRSDEARFICSFGFLGRYGALAEHTVSVLRMRLSGV